MQYFTETHSMAELKSAYRRLALLYHPDVGGNIKDMQRVNAEYRTLAEGLKYPPRSLREVRIGNIIYVNRSKCIVTAVEKKIFKVRSLETKREAYFSKTTGFAMLNYKLKASLSVS
jgi:hypothetical protein